MMTSSKENSPMRIMFKLATFAAYLVASRVAFRAAVATFPSAAPRLFIMGGTFAVHSVVFWGVSVMMAILNFTQWPPGLYSTKIQETVVVGWRKHIKCFCVVVANQLLVLLPLQYFASDWLTARGMSVDPDDMPSVPIVLRDLLVCLILEEVMFFYCHWAMHHVAYKYIHKQHHDFPAPIAMAAEYAHPVEFLLGNCLPILAGPLASGTHCQVLWLWIMIAISATCNAHCGHDFPFTPFHSSRVHDFHHSNFKGNYGTTGLLDWLHGTDRQFKQRMATLQVKQGKKAE